MLGGGAQAIGVDHGWPTTLQHDESLHSNNIEQQHFTEKNGLSR
jgi:hypothetical protein